MQLSVQRAGFAQKSDTGAGLSVYPLDGAMIKWLQNQAFAKGLCVVMSKISLLSEEQVWGKHVYGQPDVLKYERVRSCDGRLEALKTYGQPAR